MRRAEIGNLGRSCDSVCYEVHLAWDGSGGYVVAIATSGDGMEREDVLCHEDGAPLRFPNAQRAHAMAKQCGLVATRRVSAHSQAPIVREQTGRDLIPYCQHPPTGIG